MDLDDLIEQFRSHSGGYQVETARGECVRESETFACLLDEHGIESEVIEGYQFAEPKEIREIFGKGIGVIAEMVITQGHTAVRVGDLVYDWTARQFWPHDQPWPLVQFEGEWRETWKMPPRAVDSVSGED